MGCQLAVVQEVRDGGGWINATATTAFALPWKQVVKSSHSESGKANSKVTLKAEQIHSQRRGQPPPSWVSFPLAFRAEQAELGATLRESGSALWGGELAHSPPSIPAEQTVPDHSARIRRSFLEPSPSIPTCSNPICLLVELRTLLHTPQVLSQFTQPLPYPTSSCDSAHDLSLVIAHGGICMQFSCPAAA